MKINNLVLFLFLFWNMTLCVMAELTNELYVTDDGSHIYADPKAYYDQLLSEAKKTRESLPAKDFPEGNWGEAVNGLQLSLRFTSKTYTNCEHIDAILLVRNITNRYVQYVAFPDGSGNTNGPVAFVVTTTSGKIISSKQQPPVLLGGHDYLIPPHTQRKYVETLNNRYHLANGTYFIRASLKTTLVKVFTTDGRPDKIEYPEVNSAGVPIEINDSF